MGSGFSKALYRNVMGSLEGHRRRRISFSLARHRPTEPTIYFLAPDYNRPSGGTMVIYRHVDILNAAGIRARALHERPGFRYTWFDNKTPVADLATTQLDRSDLLVVPETDIDLVAKLPAGIRHVIFNQNSHLSWRRADEPVQRHYLNNPDLLGVVTVSAHNHAMLQYAFKGAQAHRLHLGLDRALFWAPPEPRAQRIAYMPRRGGEDAPQLLNMLTSRGLLDGWEIVPLDGLRHAEVAAQLRTSKIFLAFTYQEGFGLPAAEAMACGNYVVGYHGFGGREFFDPHFSAPIETGDVLNFAKAVEEAIIEDHLDPAWCSGRGQQASAFVLSEYSVERERREVVDLYSGFIGQTARRARATAT